MFVSAKRRWVLLVCAATFAAAQSDVILTDWDGKNVREIALSERL